jgi:aminoglycoside/choline kinase family phosphotransferase
MPPADTPLPAEAAALLREWLGEEWTARPLAGDASVRAYYRIATRDGNTFVLAWYPEEVRMDVHRNLEAHDAVVEHARIPRVIRHDAAAVLQQDIGDRTLFDILHDDREHGVRLYESAIELLVDFQHAGVREVNPRFTAEFFSNELAMTREFYVEKLMETPRAVSESLINPFRKLAEKVASHPYVLCHRDFHGQNIHLFNEQLYVIDFQDMRMGPDTYDLASLLRDRGVCEILGDAAEETLIERYRTLREDDEGLRRRYFETLLQRSLKILGTFSRQPLERGKMHYLDFIPATLNSVRRCLSELPGHGEIAELFPMSFSLGDARERAIHYHSRL